MQKVSAARGAHCTTVTVLSRSAATGLVFLLAGSRSEGSPCSPSLRHPVLLLSTPLPHNNHHVYGSVHPGVSLSGGHHPLPRRFHLNGGKRCPEPKARSRRFREDARRGRTSPKRGTGKRVGRRAGRLPSLACATSGTKGRGFESRRLATAASDRVGTPGCCWPCGASSSATKRNASSWVPSWGVSDPPRRPLETLRDTLPRQSPLRFGRSD